MVIVTEFNCSIQIYLACFAQLVFLRPTTCPNCQADHSFVGHGFYQRKPLSAERAYLIRIKRWCCRARRHTLSLLPSFLLCFRHYLLEVIQAVVIARYEEAASWRQVASDGAGGRALCVAGRALDTNGETLVSILGRSGGNLVDSC